MTPVLAVVFLLMAADNARGVIADNPPFDSLVDTYIHYGGGNCTKFAAIFSPGTSMLTPIAAGPTGINDVTDPVAVCKWITQPGRDSTYNPSANTLIPPYSLIPLSASLYRMGFSWDFHCDGKKQRVFTTAWVAMNPGRPGAVFSQWELDSSSLVAIDTPQGNPDGQGMCPHY